VPRRVCLSSRPGLAGSTAACRAQRHGPAAARHDHDAADNDGESASRHSQIDGNPGQVAAAGNGRYAEAVVGGAGPRQGQSEVRSSVRDGLKEQSEQILHVSNGPAYRQWPSTNT